MLNVGRELDQRISHSLTGLVEKSELDNAINGKLQDCVAKADFEERMNDVFQKLQAISATDGISQLSEKAASAEAALAVLGQQVSDLEKQVPPGLKLGGVGPKAVPLSPSKGADENEDEDEEMVEEEEETVYERSDLEPLRVDVPGA